MNLVKRVFGASEQRSINFPNPTPFLTTGFFRGTSYTGKPVTPHSAMGLTAVYAAVRILAESVGSLPLQVYRTTDLGRELASDDRLWSLLHDEPNPEMASGELFELITGHLSLWGNAYLYKERDTAGRVTALWPILPSRVQVGYVNGHRVFNVANYDTPYYDGMYDTGFMPTADNATVGNERDILHIRNFGTDGIYGLSPVAQCRQEVALHLAQQEYVGRFYQNSAQPSGLLTVPSALSDAAVNRLKADWDAMHRGLGNSAKTAVLEQGVQWQQMALPMQDQQFIEQRRFGVQEVARIFRIPAWMLNESNGDTMTYKTADQYDLMFVKWSLRPLLVKIEKSLQRDGDIFLNKGLFPEFNVDALLRADTKTRYEAYQLAIASGWMTRNEVRELENLAPVDGGDELATAAPAQAPASNATGETK